jgi:hypothetical protein
VTLVAARSQTLAAAWAILAVHPRKYLTDDERRALHVLDINPCGATEDALVLAYGCDHDMLTGLVDAKLAKRYHLTVTARGRTTGVTVTYMKIMAAGRTAIRKVTQR